MKAFKEYSMGSCLLECRANYVYASCGCLPYYYPNFGLVWKIENGTTCDWDGLKCVANLTSTNNLSVFY